MATKKTEAEAPPTPPEPTDSTFFRWLRSLGIQREPGWLGGVSAGLATRLGIDPLIVRGILVVVALLGGPALILYAAAWLLLPDVNNKIHLEQLAKGNVEPPIAGIGVMVLLAMLPIAQGFWFAGAVFWGEPNWLPAIGRALWTLAVLALIVLFVIWIARHAKTPTAPLPPTSAPDVDFAGWREQQAATKAETDAFRARDANERAEAWREEHERATAEAARQRAIRAEERRRTRSHPLFSFLVIGIALVAGGITTLRFHGDAAPDVTSVVAGLAVAIAVLGLGIIVNGVIGKRAGGASGLATLLLFPLVFLVVVPQGPHLQLVGNERLTPTDSTSSVPDFYAIGSGNVMLDLRDYYPTPGPDEPNSSSDEIVLLVGAGDVAVYLPADEYGVVDVKIGRGEVGRENGFVAEGAQPEDDVYRQYGPITSSRFTSSQRVLTVRIYVGSGDVSISHPATIKEFQ